MPELLDDVVAELRRVPGVVAVAVSGSIADGTADRFSDLDLECVLEEVTPQLAEPIRSAVHRVHAVGDERWVVPNRLLSTVGLDWLRVDVSLVSLAGGCSHNALILWSRRDGDLPRQPAPSFSADADGLTRRVSRFLRSLGLLVRDIHRGDLRIGCWATDVHLNIQGEDWYEPPTWPEEPGQLTKMMHFEVEVDDLEAAVATAIEAGGTQCPWQPPTRNPARLRIMLDPAGHPLCLFAQGE